MVEFHATAVVPKLRPSKYTSFGGPGGPATCEFANFPKRICLHQLFAGAPVEGWKGGNFHLNFGSGVEVELLFLKYRKKNVQLLFKNF